MSKTASKNELIKLIRVKHRQLERHLFYFERGNDGTFVASDRPKLDEEEMLQPGVVGEGSVKDVLAHLIAQERHFLEWYRTSPRRDIPEALAFPASRDDLEAMTPAMAEYRRWTMAEILTEFMASYRQVLTVVQAIPETDLLTPGRCGSTEVSSMADYIATSTSDRYDWAKEQVRRFKKTHAGKQMNKKTILDSIHVERRRLVENLALLSEEELVQPGVVGEWSVKDLLAHLVDWEQRFLGWYRAGLRGQVPETPAPGLTWGQLHVLNRQIFERNRHRPLDDVMAEFHASYHETLETVEAIPGPDIFAPGRFAWTGRESLATYILANTASHYRWAKTQLRKWIKKKGRLLNA